MLQPLWLAVPRSLLLYIMSSSSALYDTSASTLCTCTDKHSTFCLLALSKGRWPSALASSSSATCASFMRASTHLGAEGAQLYVGSICDVAGVALLPVQRHLVLLVGVGQQVYRACGGRGISWARVGSLPCTTSWLGSAIETRGRVNVYTESHFQRSGTTLQAAHAHVSCSSGRKVTLAVICRMMAWISDVIWLSDFSGSGALQSAAERIGTTKVSALHVSVLVVWQHPVPPASNLHIALSLKATTLLIR